MVKNRMVGTLVITSLLFTPTNTVSTSTNVENEVTFNRINNDITPKIYNENYCKLKKEFETKQNIINRVNERFDKIEEQHRQEEEKKRLEEEEERNSYDIELIFSFYTSLSSENGGNEGITCTGSKLKYGDLASNVWELGTQFKTQDGQIFTVADKGGSHFNSYNRVDCYIPRQTGESDYQYYKRVNNMGHKTITVKLIKE